jgi:hypothetical protein
MARSTAQLSFGLLILDPDAHRLQEQYRTRRCLSCAEDFASTHAGNRICGDCKSLAVWGTPNDFSVSASF